MKTEFQIKYRIDDIEIYQILEKQLIKEGWKKTNHTYPIDINIAKPHDMFSTWFTREWADIIDDKSEHKESISKLEKELENLKSQL